MSVLKYLLVMFFSTIIWTSQCQQTSLLRPVDDNETMPVISEDKADGIESLCGNYTQAREEIDALKERLQSLENSLKQLADTVKTKVPEYKLSEYQGVINDLSRQVAMQQLFVEERIRSDGNSGVKQVRSVQHGTKAYYSQTVTANAAGAIHDHSNYYRTVGLGELDVVMNGVEFKTRHNDYALVQPSSSSSKYHATEPIEFPPVPPEVLNKTTVAGQIHEMRMFFKAFRGQNSSLRNYKPYFPAVLCYLEGAWTQTKSNGSVDEPFNSTRHKIDAKSWYDLQEKIWFTASNGRKDDEENYAFLPTTISEFTDKGPRYAQWNYRVLCHKLRDDLPKTSMHMVDDLATRMRYKWTFTNLRSNRQARYQLKPSPSRLSKDQVIPPGALLDKIMHEIPGKDNYGAVLYDTSRYHTMKKVGSSINLNAAYYNRHFVSGKGAMGSSIRRRGFSDDFLFTALTTHQEVVPRGVNRCYGDQGCNKDYQRVTYAIPLEIIYLNPLQLWNPFNLSIHSEDSVPSRGNRKGHYSVSKAFNGTSQTHNYKTPANFYSDDRLGRHRRPADTVRGSVGVLDPEGKVKSVVSSGIKVIIHQISGVGGIRQRFPIYPVHQEGSHEWIHLEALKEMVYDPERFQRLMAKPSKPSEPSTNSQGSVNMYTNVASNPFPHDHELTLEPEQISLLNQGGNITVVTDERGAHTHTLVISIKSNLRGKVTYRIVTCDGVPERCWDGHSKVIRGD